MWNGQEETTSKRIADVRNATFESSKIYFSFSFSVTYCFLFSDTLVGPQPLASEKNSGKIPVSEGEDSI